MLREAELSPAQREELLRQLSQWPTKQVLFVCSVSVFVCLNFTILNVFQTSTTKQVKCFVELVFFEMAFLMLILHQIDVEFMIHFLSFNFKQLQIQN